MAKCQNGSQCQRLLKIVSNDGVLQVEAQVRRLCNIVGVTGEGIQVRQEYCRRLCQALDFFFPGCKLTLFGSSVSGYGTKGSDLDIFLDCGYEEPENFEVFLTVSCALSHLTLGLEVF